MGTQVGIVGAGSWGIALAHVLSGNGHDVTVWSRSEDSVSKLRAYRGNEEKLPGIKLPESVKFTSDMEETVKDKDIIVVVVPSAHMRETIKRMKPFINESEEHKQIIVNCSKGIEEESLMVMSDVILDELPGCHVCVLSGPSHAEEVGKSMPTTIVVGAFDKDIAKYVQNIFMNDYFRVYISPDMLGIEIGAALKNVVALAAGIADGFGCGDNAKAALITRGITEISRLGMAMGGKFETFAGLSGIGDLIVTCASMHSRNRRAGILIGQGKTYQEAMDEVKMVVEGVYSAKAALKLAEKYDVEMPIIKAVNDILFSGKSLQEAVKDLMLRDKKIENNNLEW
ncbi:NAD(P)H-dependent glycerol-3-phosphate dehydrogenase [Butyrivibrio sp. XB500-5]|uniref:NAD(P)H-dependent glycerol-3-phosphate dehydrogenase n=1 Tax=Butyrivibrio sp. XB500-5 TaxID=2364880 RepID=UPI000EA9094F|nr:NAD(P)H-dependent glycerol-3-phosphate dehydrogenase [Butyrivibrio sp. XB500-5]RKM62659.1 NAD(P)H-dependent glycerol-3-phosphate dehydrogenase [Butyrivibrio sp. XB500-5]